ncbi:MAG: ATP-binding protein [Candidatus Nitricoxidivorans perseverans]|uniref:histidine kinase n=1 Tax=Candidatus Nitricoxidivorans perseverans TaxID=2975601 RepID=A0AA49IY51_9PROT|nr:MAG: ATP-binding protein [Candidatus Nitricoxidivorans perseverans]
MNSIRNHLLVWQISALLVTGLLVSVITYLLAWDAFNRIRDNGLEQIAYSIVRHGIEYDNNEEVRNDRGQFVSQIWAADGSLIFSSMDDIGPTPQPPGLHVVDWNSAEWRVYSLKEGGLTVQVATTSASRARKFMAIAPWLLIPFAVLIVVLGLFIRAAVGRALAPLENLRGEIGRRSASSLRALDGWDMPEEVAPLVATLNELLARLDVALAAQRRFIADAAHELRTPLAAVKLQAQIVRRSEGESEREIAQEQLENGVDRAAHLVEQLLRMARLEPSASQSEVAPPFVPIALDALAKQVVADYSAQAEARDIDLGIGSCVPLTVPGQADSLRMMLGNLVDNAVRYTPAGGRVDVDARQEADSAVLSVSDNGPGIPAAERERVFDRFHRLAGADMPGSGLGLAIARQVATLHGGRIELADAPGGGLIARVALPLQG